MVLLQMMVAVIMLPLMAMTMVEEKLMLTILMDNDDYDGYEKADGDVNAHVHVAMVHSS